jgi:hypothetical protein
VIIEAVVRLVVGVIGLALTTAFALARGVVLAARRPAQPVSPVRVLMVVLVILTLIDALRSCGS